jgi:hypothetical protein
MLAGPSHKAMTAMSTPSRRRSIEHVPEDVECQSLAGERGAVLESHAAVEGQLGGNCVIAEAASGAGWEQRIGGLSSPCSEPPTQEVTFDLVGGTQRSFHPLPVQWTCAPSPR